MGTKILGLNLSHDSSACLISDDGIVAIAEERLSRRKHDRPLNARGERNGYLPKRSIAYCLDASGTDLGEIDRIVASTTYLHHSTTGRRRELRPEDLLAAGLDVPEERISVVGHHLGHAASAAICSGLDSATVLVVDGGGSIVACDAAGNPSEFERTSIYRWDGRSLTLLARSTGGPPDYGNSLGDVYQMTTTFLGFGSGDEGKVMGLSSYCRSPPPTEFAGAFRIDGTGRHHIAPNVQYTADGGYPAAMVERFGPPRASPRPGDAADQAAAGLAQHLVGEAVLELARCATKLVGSRNLCVAGGVGLNCVANGRLATSPWIDELFVQPASGDDGTALGNALLGWAEQTGRHLRLAPFSPYLGRNYGDDAIEAATAGLGPDVTVSRPNEPAHAIAAAVAAGRVVGLFHGRSEFGPRALGHRSLLADARDAGMRDRLNARVKHREWFRPFAPVTLTERCRDYFDLDLSSPYMLLTALSLQPELLPSVTHVDGSARIQTVDPSQVPFLAAILDAFGGITGHPVMINTSFNDAEEPLVETPSDAVRCFLATDIDDLFIGPFQLSKVIP